MSRLGEFCDRFIEAGWLVALALVPLYINFFSFRTVEPGKAYLLRVIVLLMVGAWFVKLWEGGADRGVQNALASLWKNPLAVPVVAYVVILLLTTAASVAPALSFHGAFIRLQGAYTTLVYIALFCLMVLNLRTREQFDRIVSVLLLASVPIALYAVAQEWRWDPLTYIGPKVELKWRARSTMGQHIFLGAYLIMLMPWTAARLIEAVGRWWQGTSSGASGARTWLLGAGGILVQNLALAAFLVYSATNQHRWITLPVLTGYVFLVVWTIRLGANAVPPPAMVGAYAGLLMLQALALAFTQARGPWLAALAGAGVFGILLALRWGMRRLLVGVVGCAVVVGLFVAALNVPQGPLQPLKRYALLKRLGSLSDFESRPIEMRLLVWEAVGRLLWTRPNIGLSRDRLAGVRPVIGYGPETLGLAIEKVLPPGLGRQDTWRTAFDRAHNDFLNHLAESGLLGLTAFLLLLVVFYRMTLKALWQSQDRVHQLCLIALITAMTAHLVELQFGVAVTSTRMLFWAFLTLGVFLARPLLADLAEGARETRSPWRSWMIPYTLLMLFLIVVFTTTVKIQGIPMGLFVGFGGMLLGMLLLALDLEPLAGKQRARWQNWWIHTITVGVVGLLIFHGSFRPLVADAFFRFGHLMAKSKQPLASVLAYQRAATVEPREGSYYAALGGAFTRLGNALWTQKPDLKPPEGFQATALLARTLDPRRIVQLGGEGVLALADASFQEARRLQPMDPLHVFNLARVNHYWGLRGRQDRLDVALGYYQETAKMSPNRLRTLVDWGMVYLAKHQPVEALDRIHAAQALGQESWLIHYALALVYNQMGNTELALKEVEIAARDSPRGKERGLQEFLEKLKHRAGPLPEEEEGK